MRSLTVLGLACGLASPAFAQRTTVPTTGPTPSAQPPTLWSTQYRNPIYQMNDVGKALNLTPAQVAQLNTLSEQTQAKYQADYGKLGTLTDADRFTRMQELNRQYYGDWSKGAGSVFNETQRARYQQLNYQYGGFNSFYDPAVQKQLNLTADQQRDLRAQWDWSSQRLQDINRAGATDPTKGTQMYRDYWTQRQERMNQFLTPDQQKAWQSLVGEPYTFQPNFTPAR